MADTGASSIYFAEGAPVSNIDPHAPAVTVGTATGQRQLSTATAELRIPHLPAEFPRKGHIMPGFEQTLIGVGPICDAGFTVTFSSDAVVVKDYNERQILGGWREHDCARLSRFSLLPDSEDVAATTSPAQTTTQAALSAYDLPSVKALVRYFHAAAGYPVKDMWLKAVKAGNYVSWPGLTLANAANYCPSSDATVKGHMVQTRHNMRSRRR